jgi:hypothetical protein
VLPGQTRRGHTNPPPLLTEEELLSLLDAKLGGWKRDREGWVTVERDGMAWRIHYRHGEILEIGWWGTLGHPDARS